MRKSFNGHNLRIVLFLLGLFFTLNLTEARAANVYGTTGSNQLIRFDTGSPTDITIVGTITGLQSGETILGLDFRPRTGQLYALSSGSRIYTINRTNAAANFIGALTTPLSGTSFGFDFSALADRIRIVSDADQNLSVNPNNASTTVETPLTFAADDINSGRNPSAVGAAYNNNFLALVPRTLYDIDSNLDILVTQDPDTAGTLRTVGKLGVDTTNVVGFDITSSTETAYALLTVAGFETFYTINLSTGDANLVGILGITGVTAMAVEIGTASANFVVFGITTDNNLVQFISNQPNFVHRTAPITGLQAGENVLAIDFRPATGQLYALGSNSRLYTINPTTGAAAFVAALSVPLSGTNFGFDFNPTSDRIRIVSNTDQNLRVNPADGSTIVDTPLAYAGTDPNVGRNPNIVGAAYTNNFAGATSTTLYDIDSNLDILVTQFPPNAGALSTVGRLGVNTTGEVGFDIAPNNTALAALQISGTTRSTLYSIDLTTGSAAVIGPIGSGAVIRGIAIATTARQVGAPVRGALSAVLDYSGDGTTDFVVFHPPDVSWSILHSPNGPAFGIIFGLETDIFTPGDYDGDGSWDFSVWRPQTGFFFVRNSFGGDFQSFQFGLPGDEPVARDYDGDGRTDFAVVRRQNGVMTWFIRNSSTGTLRVEQFGLATDRVAPGDYDGDLRFDLAVYRGAAGQMGTFYVRRSTLGFTSVQWGLGSDLVVPGDYDGDGRTDYAVVREQDGLKVWYILRSSDNTLFTVQYGTSQHLTAQGDYDGDGKTDVAVYDRDTGRFFVLQSSTLTDLIRRWGQSGDYPVANYDTH